MYVKNGLCCDKEGKLSGSNILMNEGVKNCVETCKIDLEQALKMASLIPARVLHLEDKLGWITKGTNIENLIVLDTTNFSCTLL